MVSKTEILLLAALFAFVIFVSSNFVLAAIQIISPANGTNHSGNIIFNVTFLNNTDISITGLNYSDVNATFYLEKEGQSRITAGNSSNCSLTGVANEVACFGIIAASALTNNIYNVSVEIFNMSREGGIGESVNSSANTTFVTIDSVAPVIDNENFTSPLTGGNLSEKQNGLIIINVSIFDATSGNITLYINITNATDGKQNATIGIGDGGVIYGLNNYGNDWNGTINTSHYPDGTYNITVWANDTFLGNLNNSAFVNTIVFDNVGPTITLSCTPNPVTEGDVTTCSCSATDPVSGVKAGTGDSKPSTSSTGTYTESCSVSDYSGNSKTSSVEYTVSAASTVSSGSTSGTSSGGGGGGGGGTVIDRKAQSWSKIDPEEAVTISTLGENYGIKEIVIDVKETANNPRVTVKSYDSKPAEVTVEKSGKVYKHIEIETENLVDKLESAKIVLQVPKSWVSENGLQKEDVALFKFTESTWEELTTSFKDEDAENYIYEAEVTSFSFFAIAEKGTQAEGQQPSGPAGEAAGQETTTASSSSTTWIITIIILIIIIVAVVFFLKKRK